MFTKLFNQLTPQRFFVALMALLLWIIAAWLMTPFLQWPLGAAAERFSICLYFAAATLLLPLVIGMAVSPITYSLARPPQKQDHRITTFLKVTGAYVGYNTFAGTLFFMALGWYYLTGHALPATLGGLLIGIPLLFGYVTARRIPLERVRMFQGDLKPHDADLLFLIVMFCFGPFLAGFVYLWHSYLAWRPLGILLVLALLVMLWWQQRPKRTI
ncbi:MAG: hypothetical protein KF893_24320 [Caldilineaceae bacterium]|nr:hypothetical protein [Caldilineaceae bacterium]